ncbi:MAG: OstA-like protein [Ferruginibacter sp.]
MKLYIFSYQFLLIIILIIFSGNYLYAQQPVDSTREITILSGNSLSQKVVDAFTTLQILAGGNAKVKQGNTTLSGDSIILNPLTRVAEVFGNVHINDADSVHTYGQYLKYLGNERIAYIKKNVKLTDGKGTLYTDDLEYNLTTGIASYKNGGRVVNGTTVLTSANAVYYSDTKDVYFKQYVHLTDPKYDIVADSLLYNTFFKTATFISPTRIKTKEGGTINTKSGTYNLETGEAITDDYTAYTDSTRSLSGKKMAYEEKSGILQVQENGKLVDSVNKVTVLGNIILLDKFKNSFLAAGKPVMILYRGTDSTYIAGDTLFSGIRKYDTVTHNTIIKQDTLQKITLSNASNQDSIRYFLAFHHVRIFNDSLQSVADSLYYSTEDSVFRLFKDPVVWNGKTQLTGDTIYMFTEKQQPKRLYVFNNGMVINKTDENLYNQVAGRNINAYFIKGIIDYVRVKGSPAESIFYPEDEDSAYVGMNRSSGDVIDLYFEKQELNKVKFQNNVEGILYPLNQVPAGTNRLKNFKWLDGRRPKNKLELFE